MKNTFCTKCTCCNNKVYFVIC